MSDVDPLLEPEPATLAEMAVLLGELKALVTTLQANNVALRDEIVAKDVEIAELKRVIFGPKSER